MVAAYQWLCAKPGFRPVSARDLRPRRRHQIRRAASSGFWPSYSACRRSYVRIPREPWGCAAKPETLRLRADPTVGIAVGLSDVVAPGSTNWPTLDRCRQGRQLVIENEITFLSVPSSGHVGVVLWGKGFEVDRAGSMPWLADVEVRYWGDLDTHGFAILDQLRAWLPQTRSLLMERDTLLAHRDRWVHRGRRQPRHDCHRLSPEEQGALRATWSPTGSVLHVRLEQERIDWGWVTQRL